MTCQSLIDRYGPESKYVKDCQIRAIRGISYEVATQLVGHEGPPPIVIQAGIGTLVKSPDEESFTPAPTLLAKAAGFAQSLLDRAPASADEQARRLAICGSCPHWLAASQTCGVCGCGTRAKSGLQAQVCPKGLW
jgi:hypothetical protein